MHPNPKFRWTDGDAMRAFVRQQGFATLVIPTDDGPRAAYVPVVIDGDRLRFHLSRANPLNAEVVGSDLLCSVLGTHGYISPDWYENGPEEVPTWNYAAVEMDGTARQLSDDELTDQLRALSGEFEDRLKPKAPWTLDKATAEYVAKLSRAIIGYEMTISRWRGVRKFSQNKPAPVRHRVADALDRMGEHDHAMLVRGID